MRAMLIPRRQSMLPLASAMILALAASDAQAQTKKPSSTSSTPEKSSAPSTQSAPSSSEASAPKEPEKEKKEEEEEEKETNRAIYMSAEIAFTRVDIGAISNDLAFDKTAANGVLYGFAAGLRSHELRYGLRWRVHDTTEYAIWSLAASLGYGLPLRPVSPIFSIHVGYAWDQKIQQGAFAGTPGARTLLEPQVDLRGLVAGIDVNASYWVTRFLRLGLFIGGDFYWLHRAQADVPGAVPPLTPQERQHPLFTEDGSGMGFSVNAGFRGAFDIAF